MQRIFFETLGVSNKSNGIIFSISYSFWNWTYYSFYGAQTTKFVDEVICLKIEEIRHFWMINWIILNFRQFHWLKIIWFGFHVALHFFDFHSNPYPKSVWGKNPGQSVHEKSFTGTWFWSTKEFCRKSAQKW